jgi:SAM-dependent methyltransferase
MNTKIFTLIKQNLDHAFALPKYESIRGRIGLDTQVEDLPWTPARYRKFRDAVEGELDLASDWTGSLADIVADLDRRYLRRFFGEIWKPRTDDYNYTGWNLAEEINKQDPQNVLDVGCGYNQFRGRIPNLVGIDPNNDCADYMVDILDYRVRPGTHDHIICLGSINFNSREDIEARFAHCVDLLAPGGHMYFRANPGIQWKNGPWVEIFAWSFQVVKELEETYQLRLLTFKQDNDRLYFVYQKPVA